MVVTLYIDFLRVEKNIIVQRSRRPAMFGVGMAEKIANSPVCDVNGKRWTLSRDLGKSKRFARSHYDLFMYANWKLKLDSTLLYTYISTST